jgi:hypothetical protein
MTLISARLTMSFALEQDPAPESSHIFLSASFSDALNPACAGMRGCRVCRRFLRPPGRDVLARYLARCAA